jgi:HAD superfamily hydrolase (TIGR01459 family)
LNAIRLIDGIGPIADQYDLFLLDQWGVLHNGEAAHPEAVEAMRRLRHAGKSIVLISNSSKRSPSSVGNLERLGVERGLYDDVITSGEMAWQEMKAGTVPFLRDLGPRCFLFTWGGDASFLKGLRFTAVDTVDDADFLLLAGTSGANIDIYEDELRAGIRRGLPMVCLNRDYVSVDPAGRLVECSGKVAARYEALGGKVRYYGKPGREIYEAAFARAPGSHRHPIIIGDSLHHDIAGGRAAGIGTIFITAGIHSFDLGIRAGETPTAQAVTALCKKEGVCPDFAMAKLVW